MGAIRSLCAPPRPPVLCRSLAPPARDVFSGSGWCNRERGLQRVSRLEKGGRERLLLARDWHQGDGERIRQFRRNCRPRIAGNQECAAELLGLLLQFGSDIADVAQE